MKKNIFIGIDGGGTKSKLIIQDENGTQLAESRSGAANIRLSVNTTIKSIDTALKDALRQIGITFEDPSYAFHLGVGLAGTEVPSACTEFLAKLPIFESVCLQSDPHTACLGAHNGGDGAILIVGTGVVGYKHENGKNTKIGGWGFPHSDEGSGAWLGLETMRLTLQWQDKRIEVSPLLEAVLRSFNNNLSEMVTWANQANATDFATLAPLFMEHLQQEDRWAVVLMERSAKAVSEVAHCLFKDSADSLPLCMFGGLASYVEPYLDETIKSRIVPRQYGATQGALIMVRKAFEERESHDVNA